MAQNLVFEPMMRGNIQFTSGSCKEKGIRDPKCAVSWATFDKQLSSNECSGRRHITGHFDNVTVPRNVAFSAAGSSVLLRSDI
jgi:hypothetical protein